MNSSRPPIRRFMIFALIMALLAPTPAAAQAPASSYEVRKRDTLFGIARKTKHANVTINQMIIAIYNANRNAFPGDNPRSMAIGTVLAIPRKDEVAAINRAEADRLVREYRTKWDVVPAPEAETPPPPPPAAAAAATIAP